MELIKARKYGPKNSSQPTVVTFKKGEKEVQYKYSFVRGSVVWPHEDTPGIILVAGKEVDENNVVIFEEAEFSGLSKAAVLFERLYGYLPGVYYFHDVPENQGFIRHLRKYDSLSGKLPFLAVSNPEGIDFGNNLIREYLQKGQLVVPPDSVLAKQLQEARQDLDPEQYHAVAALRFLLQGVDERKWAFEIFDLDLASCSA